jgi:hypothetical protein
LVFENGDDDTEALTMFFFLFDEDDVDESRRELLLGVFFFVILFVVLFLFELNDICDARVVHSIDSLSLFFSLLRRGCSRAGERKNEEKKKLLVVNAKKH